MSDPPKPKPGSLRDRIAAFEKQPAASSGPAPPAPRPKPSGLQWKPRQASPPPAVDDAEGVKKGGMSASDAKETIGKGVSLKERMAALNNRGAFGGAPTSPPPTGPKPNVERPKWKPPPVVAPPADEDTGDAPPVTSPPVSTDKPAADAQEQPAESEESQEAPAENDEEEERQRRAALAARMARLGGARVGMAPPVLGRKPKSTEAPKEEEAKASPSEDAQDTQADPSADRQAVDSQELPEAPAVATDATQPIKAASQDESAEEKKPSDSEPTKSTSQDDSSEKRISDATSPSAATDSPLSPPAAASPRMPVPAAPRRAAPPRKKAIKTPAPPEPEALAAPVNVAEAAETSQCTVEVSADTPKGDREAEIGDVDKTADPIDVGPEEKEDKPTDVLGDQDKVVEEPVPLASKESFEDKEAPTEGKGAPETIADETVRKSTAESIGKAEQRSERPPSPEIEKDDEAVAQQMSTGVTERQESAEPERSLPEAEEPRPAPSADADAKSPSAEEEEDEETRRKRVAERIAKMGGINPFAPSPRRQSSVAPQEATSPTDQPRRQSSTQPREVPSAVADEHHFPPAPKKSLESSTSSIGESAPEQRQRSLSLTNAPAEDTKSSGRSVEVERLEEDDEAQPQPTSEESAVSREDTPVYQSTLDRKVSRGPSRKATEDTAPSSSPESMARALPDRPSQSINRTLSTSMHEDEPRTSSGRPASTSSSQRSAKEPESSESEYDERDQESNPLVLPPRTVTSVISSPSPAPSPPPTRVPPPNQSHASPTDEQEESDTEPKVLSPLARPARSLPPPPPPRPDTDDEMPGSDDEETDEKALPLPSRRSEDKQKSEGDEGDSALPTPPRRGIPPPPSNAARAADSSEDEDEGEDDDDERHTPTIAEQEQANPGLSEQRRQSTSETEQTDKYPSHEILDEDEGDPIDPSFHSPHAPQFSVKPQVPDTQASAERPTSPLVKRSQSSPEPRATLSVHRQEQESVARDDDEEDADAEQARRRTIAERMAKLGGIKFGAAPPMGRPMPAARREADAQSPLEAQDTSEEPVSQLTEEEEEAARKQRIAAKMATMGGMRFGMMPPGVQAARSPPLRRESQDETSSRSAAAEDTTPPPLPPSRPPPPPANRPPPSRAPPPPAAETESEYESTATSDDGVKVEAEESEIEEVSHRDAVEEPETLSEEEAPPVPARPARGTSGDVARKASSASTSSTGRPPIPPTTQMPPRKSSTGSTYSPRASTQRPPIPQQQSDFVMVDEETEAPPPPPPQKRTSMPPNRNVPPPPSGSGSSQWEMPSVNFDDGSADLSLSWSEDSTMYPTEHKRVSQLPPGAATPGTAQTGARHELPSNLQLSADELMSVWGKVGVHLYTASSTLYENSKKMLVGDGTYNGFIRSAMREVPNALVVDTPADTYGYLVYHQNGASVQKRASEIMPGDIVFLADAKFKGHKGLQAYSQHVGTGVGGSVLGIVSEFEPKKSKVKVYQANQHVGQQTVESVSYRLDDLKTGVFKVFRVLEA